MQCSLYKFTKNEVHKKYTLNDFDIIKEVTDQIKWKNPAIYIANGRRRQHRLRFTFDTVSEHEYLSEEFMETFQNYIDWYVISWHQLLSEDFIEKHQDKLNWKWISKRQCVSEKFIDKYKDKIVWNNLIQNDRLSISEEFIKKHDDKPWDWYHIQEKRKLSINFIINYLNNGKFYIKYIEWYQDLSEGFIEEAADYLDWKLLSKRQKLSEKFIEKHQDKLDWKYIACRQKLSEEFVEKHLDKIDIELYSGVFTQLSDAFLYKYKDQLNWTELSCTQKFTEELIDKYKDKVFWINIVKYQKLSEDFLNINESRLSYAYTALFDESSVNKVFSIEFLKKHLRKATIYYEEYNDYGEYNEETEDDICVIDGRRRVTHSIIEWTVRYILRINRFKRIWKKNRFRLRTIKAFQIQRHWRNCTYNPQYKLARKLILKRAGLVDIID